MKKNNTFFLTTIAIIIIIIIILILVYFSNHPINSINHNSNSRYKWITSGTCASNNLHNISKDDCSNYLQSSNYTITDADHGPPGCWLVLGDSLNGVLKKNPQFKGKGFGCWSNVQTDGKQCSDDFPCVCKA